MATEFGSEDPFGLFAQKSKPKAETPKAKAPSPDPIESYIASAKTAESGGDPNAKNPTSSATGLYQFTSGTWSDMMRKHPELGLTSDGRTDPAQQEKAMRAFTAENASFLQSKGIAVDGGSLYAAHFLGAGGAANVLTAGDDTPLSAVVDRRSLAANDFLNGMTVGDFKRWAAGKGSGGPAPVSRSAAPSALTVDAGFKPSDPMGLYRDSPFTQEPQQAADAPTSGAGYTPEQTRLQQLYQQLDQQEPGRYKLIYQDEADQAQKDWQKKNGSDGLIGDTWRLLGMGQVGVEASVREMVNQIPGVGPSLVAAGDQIDKWVYGKPSDERYADLYARDAATLTPETRAAREKQWWDADRGTLGSAWLDPRAYFSGAVESVPGMVATMAPGMWLAKGAFAGAVARGMSAEAASAAAARTALYSGAILEGGLGGGDTARATRAAIESMPRDQLMQSQAVQALLSQGMSADEAIKAVANDAATQAFVIGGVGTGMFGGFGDRALAQILAEGVKGSIGKRIAAGALKGFVAEGLLEEAPQSALSQFGQNVAMQTVNPDQNLGEGVLDQTLGGAAVGGIMGGATGGAGGAFRQAEEPALPGYDNAIPNSRSADGTPTAPAAPARGPLADALAQGLAAAQTPSVDTSGEDLTPRAAEIRTEAAGPDVPTMPAEYVGYPEPGKRVIVDEPTLGRFVARVEQYVPDGENGQMEAVVVDDNGEVLQVPASILQVATLTKEMIAKMDAEDQPQPADPQPMTPREEGKSRVVNGKTIIMPDETLARLYDLGKQRRQDKVLSGATSMRMRDLWSADAQVLADKLNVLPERINEIADDYRYRVERAAKNAPDDLPANMHGLNTAKLKEWRAERAKQPLLDAAPDDMVTVETATPGVTGVEITAAANAAATSPTNELPEPTQAQKEAGNYKLGHVKLGGLDISIENPAGSERKGTDKGGKAWSVKMKAHYGYIKGTVGKDKDHVDVFIRKDAGDIGETDPVFVIDQVNAEGGFDEHKVMLGYKEAAQAKRGYLANYTKGWTGLGAITETTLGDFKQWLAAGDTTKPFGEISRKGQPTEETVETPQPSRLPTTETDGARPDAPTSDSARGPSAPKPENVRSPVEGSPWFPVPKSTKDIANSTEFISPEDAAKRLAEWKAEALRIGREEDHSKEGILSLFDASGQWSQPFVDAGYTVLRFDTKHGDDIFYDSPVQVIDRLKEMGVERIVGVLAATPCTTFASSGARWWASRHDVSDNEMVAKLFGPKAAQLFDTPVEANTWMVHATELFTELADPLFHVMENPIGRLPRMTGMPKPLMIFNPNNFADPYTKRTQLWGSFSTDLETANVEPVEGSKIQSKLRGDNPEDKAARSLTPEGFAYSFFLAQHRLLAGKLGYKKLETPRDYTPAPKPMDLPQQQDEEVDFEPKVTTKGPWDFNDTYPQGKNAKRDPDEVIDQIENAIQDAQIVHLDLHDAETRLAVLTTDAAALKKSGPSAISQLERSIADDRAALERIRNALSRDFDDRAVIQTMQQAVVRAGQEMQLRDPNVEQPRVPKEQRASGGPSVPWRQQEGESVEAAIKRLLIEEGKRTGRERAIVLRQDGTVALDRVGTADKVPLSLDRDLWVASPDAAVTFHHNHPASRPLSKADISMLAYSGIREVVAHGHNGDTHRVSLTPTGRKAFGATGTLAKMHQGKIVLQTLATLSPEIFEFFNPLVQARKLSVPEATSASFAVTIKPMVDAGLMNYDGPANIPAEYAGAAEIVGYLDRTTKNLRATYVESTAPDNRRAEPVRPDGEVERVPEAAARPSEGDNRAAPADPQRAGADRPEAPQRVNDSAPEPSAPAAQAEPQSDRFAKNKLFTADKVDAARARLRAKMGQLNSGIDPEVLIDGMTIAGAYIEAGVRDFADYAKAMVGDFGDGITPYLLSFWEGARNYPGLDTKGMTSHDESATAHAAMLKPEATKTEAVGTVEPKPAKRTKKTGAAGDRTLTQDFGVEHIDAYSDEGEQVKEAFMKDAVSYLRAVADILAQQGFSPQQDRRGKDMKAVSKNESGIAGSGDITLTMRHPDTGANLYAHIAGTSLRGAVPTTPSGVSLMMRVSKRAGDTFAVAGGNTWMQTDLSAADFAAIIVQHVERARAEKADEPRKLDQRSQGALERAPAGEVSVAPEGGDTRPGAEGRSAADVPGGEPARGERFPSGRGMADGSREVSDPAGRGGSLSAGAPKPNARGSEGLGTRSADDDARVAADAVDSAATPAQALPLDFTITDEDAIGAGGAKTKFRGNVAAIKLLRDLKEANRPATRQEQAVLAKWVGWGGLSAAFPREDGSVPKGWEREAAELKDLLSPEEYRAAEASTRNAHYTAPEVVRAIWSIVQRLGFTGGRVLEPSVGAGNFLGLLPADLRNAVQVTGVELERITGGIAKHLYPKAKIHTPVGFQDVQIPDGYFDLAIGNPPFGSEKLYDANRRDLSKFSIHNYFFAKSIDALRPGGVLAMVVSNGLMDANGTDARRYLAARADLVGAIRLPNNAFLKNAGTEVTTDILVFQRRDGVDETAQPDWVASPAQLKWKDAQGKEVALNPYFQRHPEMMLGDFGAYGTMYRADSAALVARPGQDLAKELERAVGRLPAGIVKVGAAIEPETVTVAKGAETAIVGSMFIADDGSVHVRRPDVMMERQSRPVEFPSDRAKERVTGMIRVRDAFARLRQAQINPSSTDDAVERLRGRLNTVYDTFVASNGPINQDANKRLFRDDPTWPQIAALEDGFDKGLSEALAKKTGEKARPPSARKAKIFTKRTQQPYNPPTSAATAKDALAAVLSERGRVDIDAMAALYGKSPEETVAELGGLVFRTPGGAYDTADAYLSGNVKQKLAIAREAAKTDRSFERNVQALEGVIPADVEAVDIDVKPGVGWVPAKYVAQFIEHLAEGRGARAVYSKGTAQWMIEAPRSTAAAEAQWATERVGLKGVLEAVLAGRAIQVFDQLSDGKSVIDQSATDAANEKAARVAAEWRRWIWQDDERRETLARIYNDVFNTDAPRVYDGSHLQLPGKVGDDIIDLRPHQKSFIWRAMQTPTALADHTVGAGKTFALVATAMEFRRTGLARKPMFVVPNHLVGQWAADFVKLYPGARVLAATKADFEKGKRQELFSRVATGDWDAVVVSHSSFGKVPVDPEFERRFIEQHIADLEQSVSELQAEGEGRSRTVKQLAKQREALEARFKKLMDTGRKDLGMTFEEMGVDALFVDEAHEFKNLGFATRMTRIAGLGNTQGSAKAADLYTKVQSVLERTGGRNIVFATGTPISNTMAELFTVQRYLDYPALKAAGIAHFDAWARVFGEVVTDWELSPSGTYKMNSRFAKFTNMPELMQRYRAFADVITNDDIKRQLAAQGKTLPLPKVKGGKPSIIVVERNAAQARFIGEPALDEQGNERYPRGTLVWRAENLPKKQEPGADNMLKVMSDARKAALDMRLIDPGLPDFRGSKVHVAADNIKRLYAEWDAQKGTQLVFIDLSTPKAARGKEAERIADLLKRAEEGDEEAAEALEKISPDELLAVESSFSVYDDLKQKLIDRGIPAEEIAFIHDANTDAQKEELFGKVRTGRVRVLFGSTPKMGAGTNVQNRLVALHHLDAPWRPSDLEQRDGRGIRQGNELYAADPDGFELEILRYATKNTLDARQWQTIEGKARFIAQVRKGGAEREVEDVAGEAANAAEMKAAASGNPLVLEEMDLRRKLKKLDGARNEHEREQYRIRGTMSRIRAGIDKADASLPAVERDARSASAITEAGFPQTVAGEKIEKATQLGELLIAKAKEAFLAGTEVQFGRFGDFALSATPVPRLGAEHAVRVGFSAAGEHGFTIEKPIDANPTGVGTVLLNGLRSLRGEPDRIRAMLDADRQQLPKLEAQVQPWPLAKELEDTKAAHATVLAKLRPKPSAAVAAPAGAQPSANPDPVITLTGKELGVEFKGDADMPTLRAAAKAWYDQNLRGSTAIMSDGTEVRFSRQGMGKSTSDAKGDVLLRAVPAIRAIIERGRVVLREPGNRPGIIERMVIAAPVEFGGRRVHLAVSVHRSINGQVHYDFNVDRDAESGTPGVSPGGAAPKGSLPSLEMPRPAEFNLTEWDELNNVPIGWGDIESNAIPSLSDEDRSALGTIIQQVAGLSDVEWHDRILLPNGAPGWGKDMPTTAAGFYDPVRDLIGLAADTASARTAFHEAFHRLQNVFLNEQERAVLRADLPKLRRMVKENEFRRDQAAGMSAKEVEAEAFALYATGLAKVRPHSLLRAAWDRIADAARRVLNWAAGRGFQISEDVFDRAMRGEISARSAEVLGDLVQSYSTNAETPQRTIKPTSVDQQLPRRAGPRIGRPARVTQEAIVRQIKGKLIDLQPALLKVIPLNYFTELAQPNMSAVHSYLGIKRQMDAYRGKKHAEADAIAQEWLKYTRLGWGLLPSKEGKAAAAQLASLMHDATLAGIDPSSTLDEHALKPGYEELRARYLALAPAGRALFNDVRDAYVDQANELDKLLLDAVHKAQQIARTKAQERYEAELERINSSGFEGEALRKATEDASSAHARDMLRSQYAAKGRLSQMRRQFEDSRVQAPYFPLARFGRYFVSVKNGRGEVVSFSRREKAADRDLLAKQMRAEMPAGFSVEVGVLDGAAAGLREHMDPRLVAEIEAILGGAGVDEKVMDQIWQRYLETMPDLSTRKRFIHRKGTSGYDEDALRAFSSHMFHAAHQMGRIKYGLDLQEMTDQATQQARKAPDPTAGMTLANQLKQHHEWVMNPTGSAVAQIMTSAAFTWYLAGSPAAALVNLTQTPMLGIPILGARYGTAKSADALLKASTAMVRGKLTAEEKYVMERFYETGLIDRTQAHDLAGVGETGVNYSPLRARVMGVMSWAFHKAETLNRQVTALAAYRLARAAGRSAEDAVDIAHDLTWKVHFDYSNASRPAVLQNDVAKVALVFRNHTINMLYRMFRDMHQSFKGATPQARKEARYQLAAVIGMQALVGGLKGIFAFNLLMALVGLAFGNDDDPLDFKMQMEKHVMDALGPELGGILLNGAPGHYLKVDLTDRVGMPDLWWRSPPQDLQGRDEFQYYVMSTLGASVSLLGDLKFAVDLASEGNFGRALEVAAPKWAKDLLKSARYMGSGVTTLNGDTLLEASEIDPWNLISQAVGFTPAKIAETYERNNALKNAEQRVLDERRELINRYVMALMQGDDQAREATSSKIAAFNAKEYGRAIPITRDTIGRSMKTRRSNAEKRVDGVLISNEELGAQLRGKLAPAVYR